MQENPNRLTVAQLIAVLETMPQDLPVEMGMNMEYQSGVTADMVEVFETFEGERFVYITDTPGYGRDQYDEDGDYDHTAPDADGVVDLEPYSFTR